MASISILVVVLEAYDRTQPRTARCKSHQGHIVFEYVFSTRVDDAILPVFYLLIVAFITPCAVSLYTDGNSKVGSGMRMLFIPHHLNPGSRATSTP